MPFILKAGKALDDRKAEVRVQFKRPPGATFMFDGQVSRQSYGCCDSATSQSVPEHAALTALACEQVCPPNELVIRLQPKEAIYLKTNVKAPGLRNTPTQAELDLTYHMRYPDVRVAAMGCICIQTIIVYTNGSFPLLPVLPSVYVSLHIMHRPPDLQPGRLHAAAARHPSRPAVDLRAQRRAARLMAHLDAAAPRHRRRCVAASSSSSSGQPSPGLL